MFIHESIYLLRLFWPLQYPKLTFCPVSPRFVLSSKNSLKLHVSVKPASHTHRLPSRHWYFLPHQIKQIWLVYLCPLSMTGRVGCLHRRRPLTPFYVGWSPPWWRDGGFQLIGKWTSARVRQPQQQQTLGRWGYECREGHWTRHTTLALPAGATDTSSPRCKGNPTDPEVQGERPRRNGKPHTSGDLPEAAMLRAPCQMRVPWRERVFFMGCPAKPGMILPQVHLGKPCYNFYFL